MNTLVRILKDKYLPFLFAVPLFFCEFHYKGILRDAILYVTQYVYSIDPLRFWGDPSFEFGNQDSLGFFSPIFGIFLECFGVSAGAFVYTLLTQFAWVFAIVCMVKALLRLTRQRLWILPVTILLVVFFAYGVAFSYVFFFDYVPSYACSRALSIVLGFCALALLFNRKSFLSLLFILAGTAVHPITAGWCLPFWMFYFFPKTRLPVLVMALIFPFSYLLHYGVFDVLPRDWMARPLDLIPCYETISRFVLLLIFFGVQIKISSNEYIRRISISMCLLIIIALYWDVWSGFGEHIFLYQVQPWRFLWLPSVVALPLMACFVKDGIKKYIKNKIVTTHELAVFLFFISCFAPRNVILISIIAAFLLIKKEIQISLKGCIGVFVAFLFAGFIVQQYLTWCLLDFPQFLGFRYMEVYRIRDSFLVYQFVFTLFLMAYFVKKRQIIFSLMLVLSIFFSQFMLLPILPLFLAFFPKKKSLQYWGGAIIIVVLILFDGIIDVDSRRHFMLEAFARSIPWTSFICSMSFGSLYLSRKIGYKAIIFWLLICSIMATVHYVEHSEKWWRTESQIDQYLHESIFSQVKERGKMLFYVSGESVREPRLQFLTGSYFTRSVLVGAVFNKMHYRTALERSHLLYQKDLAPQSDAFYMYSEIEKKFADVDTLIDRVEFLCGMNEITHLVTDKTSLPFAKEDSTMVQKDQKVFLYGCPLAE